MMYIPTIGWSMSFNKRALVAAANTGSPALTIWPNDTAPMYTHICYTHVCYYFAIYRKTNSMYISICIK